MSILSPGSSRPHATVRVARIVILVIAGTVGCVAHGHQGTAHAAVAGLPEYPAESAGEQVEVQINLLESALSPGSGEMRVAPGVIAGNIRVRRLDTGEYRVPAGAVPRPNHWASIAPGARVVLPAVDLEIEAFAGLRTATTIIEVTAEQLARGALDIPLQPLDGLDRGAWSSGNTHLHLALTDKGPRIRNRQDADRYLATVPAADGLDLVFLSNLARYPDDENYISNEYTRADLAEMSGHGPLFGNGQEHRHNFGAYDPGYGHVLLLDIPSLIEPVSIGPGIMGSGNDDRPLRRSIDIAHGHGSTAIWCHNEWGMEDVPNWVAGRLDALNIFDTGHEGSYEDSFYRYLDVGIRVPFSTGTDWFIRDLLRVHLPADGRMDSAAWLAALRSGVSHITNGPFLTFAVDGQGSGAVLDVEPGVSLHVVASGLGRDDFVGLEVLHNGRVIERITANRQGNSYRAAIQTRVRIEEPGWLAVRIPMDNNVNAFDRPLRAHSSAVYVEVGGKSRFVDEVAEGLIEEMGRSMADIEEKGSFSSKVERAAVLDIYRSSMRELERRRKAASPGL